MAAMNLDQMVDEALDLLPPVGQTVDFDAYKEQLRTAYPDASRDIFAHMLRQNLVGKKLVRGEDGKPRVQLSRLA